MGFFLFEFSQQTVFMWFARLLVLFTAMPVHECAHGLAADRLGDDTARRMGRLTFNPLKHLDPLGCLLIFLTGFGWARPVPVDARNLSHPRRDMAVISVAGPVSNFLFALAIMAAFKLAAGLWSGAQTTVSTAVFFILRTMLITNLSIGVFNLLPIPPLDGSKILGALLPEKAYWTMMRYERVIGLALFALLFTNTLNKPLLFLVNIMLAVTDWLTTPIGWLFGWG